MTVIDLNLNIAQTLAAARRLQAKAPIAVARAVNKSMASGMTVNVRLTAKDLGIKQSFVRDRLKFRRATATGQPTATLTATAARVPVMAFSPNPSVGPSRGKGRGVSWRSKGRRVRDPQAFVATVGGQHTGVFKRVGASRRSRGAWSKNLPIRELMGPSIWLVAVKHAPETLARAQEQLTKNLKSELKFALTQQ